MAGMSSEHEQAAWAGGGELRPASYGGTDFGAHGEVCLVPWDYAIAEDEPERVSVRFWVRTYRTPFLVEKLVMLERRSSVLSIEEQALKVEQDQGTKFGFVFQGAEYEGGVVGVLEYVYSHGGQELDPNDASKVMIESLESVDGLAMERSMVEEQVAPQAVSTYAEPECEGPFLGGDAVFCRNWRYMYALAGRVHRQGPD